jgi:hypothetical protein
MMNDGDPPRRFTDLPPHTRKFIRSLGEDDIATLGRVIQLYTMMQGWCRINRYVAIAVIAALIWMMSSLESLKSMFVMLVTGRH